VATPLRLPPSAACLSASLRDLGYSLETAVADLIDNSISAEATEVQIFCDLSRTKPVLVVADNGRGMSPSEVLAAMKHGSLNPKVRRSPKDLGRFGLGLKTASFSQCLRLTVISEKNGERSGAEWNLKKVEDDDDWLISVLDPSEIADQPFIDSLGKSGTLVIWRDLDRLFEDETGQKRDEIVNEKLDLLEKHLSLVFHRFLSGEVKGHKKLSISINGHPVAAFDPFCRKNSATQVLPEETVWINDVAVQMQPFILPHHSRLAPSEYDYYQSRSDFISNQGAYIYRNGRLMAWGDWFRLVTKGEATKLARVQIDFPNTLDEAWTIDIKKSRARPPHAVRERLRQIVNKIAARSVTVHRGRGQRLFQEVRAPMWERYADHERIRYALNSEHPLISTLVSQLTPENAASLRLLVDAIATSLPVEMIYSDYSTHPRELTQPGVEETQILERLAELKNALYGAASGDAKQFLEIVRSTRLFEDHLDVAENFVKEAFA
jgi:hypothetical protein